MGVIGLITLFVRVPPEAKVGVIRLIMLFVRVSPEDTVGVIGLIIVLVMSPHLSSILMPE